MDKFVQLAADIVKLWTKYGDSYIVGMRNTLVLALAATAIGCLIGFICGVLNTIPYSKNDPLPKRFILKLIRVIVRVYVEVFRGTPMVLQAVFMYYGLPYFTNNAMKFTNIWVAALVVVSINTGAYMAETVRGGIESVDPGQKEAAIAIGMDHFQIMYNVILPQALRNVMPQLGNNLIINIKDTSVLNVISVTELYFASKSAAGVYYKYFEIFFLTCVIYFIMTFTASRLLRWVESKMDGPKDYQLVNYDPMADPCGHVPLPTKKQKGRFD